MALPTYVSAGTLTGLTTGPTIGLPSSWQEGDILFLFVETANESVTTPSGWTQVADSPQGTGTAASTTATRLTVFYKRAGATESSVVLADAGDHTIGVMISVRGAYMAGDPWDVTSGGVKGTTSTSISITGDTTTVNDCLIIIAATSQVDTTTAQFSAWANTDLANVTERVDAGNTSGNGGVIAITTGEKATAGAYGATTATLATTTVNGFITIAVKPNTSPDVALNTADGTEVTTTTPTIEFTGTDPQGEDVEYEVSINSNSSLSTVASYNATPSTTYFLYSTFTPTGQSFKPNADGTLANVKFYLQKTGSPTGSVTAKIYAHTGTYGSAGQPTGSPLATSNSMSAATVTGSAVQYQFDFPQGEQINLTNGTAYFAVLDYTGGDSSNFLAVAGMFPDGTDPGNEATFTSGAWNRPTGGDILFEVNCQARTYTSYLSTTDAGFVNTVSGGDTHPFNSGQKVSYTFQSALGLGKYSYRVRAKDPSGSNTFGLWSAYRTFAIHQTTRELSTSIRSTIPTTNDGHLVSDASTFVADQDTFDEIDTSDDSYVVQGGNKPYFYQRKKFASNSIKLVVDFEAQETVAGQVAATPTDDVSATTSLNAIWTNPDNAFATDAVYAVSVGTTQQKWRVGAFSIPTGATITSIKIRSVGHANVANTSINWTIADGGGSSWGVYTTSHTTGADTTSTSAATSTTMTITNLNSGLVEIYAAANSGTNTLSIDRVAVVVAYSIPSQAMLVDIWDDETTSWENLITKNDHAASTEFSTSVERSTNLTKYYDGSFWVTIRAYLDHTASLKVDKFTVIQDASVRYTQNNSVKASILVTNTKNNSAKADILKSNNTANNSAKGSIYIIQTQNVSSKANIVATISKDNSAIADIVATGQQPNYVKANILRTDNTQNNSTKADILVQASANNSTKANIKATTTQDNSVRANLKNTYTQDNSVKADIVVSNTDNNSAKANIKVTTAKDNSAKADIVVPYNSPQSVKANILVTGTTKNNSAKADIVVTYSADNSAKAFISRTFTNNNSVKAAITRFNSTQNVSVLGNIITTYYTGYTYDWKADYADDNNQNRGYQP